MTARVVSWLDGQRSDAPTPRPAATVLLLRESDKGVEVFLIRRVSSMAFAARMSVFPGGGVDPRDTDADLPWAGPSPAQWSVALHCEQGAARALVVAAAREVFEECGVLLAGATPDSPLVQIDPAQWAEVRASLVAHEASFAEVLAQRGLVLRSDLLHPRARWVTPQFEPRRYDTQFFAALMPPGQLADDLTSEAEHAGWAHPQDVLSEADSGSVLLMPPTRVMLEGLAAAGTAQAYLASVPTLTAVCPTLVRVGEGAAIRCEVP